MELKHQQPVEASAVRSTLVPGLVAAAGAAVINMAIVGLATVAGVEFREKEGSTTEEIPFLEPTTVTAIVMAFGAVVSWAIVTYRPRTRVFLAWLGFTLAVISVAAPIAIATTASAAIFLAVMHLVAGVSWLIALLPAGKSTLPLST